MFKYSDDKNLPLLDLKDFKKMLNYLTNDAKKEIEETYGKISTASASTILRSIVTLEQQGAELFFGERSFEVEDLLRIDENGKGIISILRLTDIQDKPKLFSTFMLSLLAEVYATFPEEGDPLLGRFSLHAPLRPRLSLCARAVRPGSRPLGVPRRLDLALCPARSVSAPLPTVRSEVAP